MNGISLQNGDSELALRHFVRDLRAFSECICILVCISATI